jgi:hypothetical protein
LRGGCLKRDRLASGDPAEHQVKTAMAAAVVSDLQPDAILAQVELFMFVVGIRAEREHRRSRVMDASSPS